MWTILYWLSIKFKALNTCGNHQKRHLIYLKTDTNFNQLKSYISPKENAQDKKARKLPQEPTNHFNKKDVIPIFTPMKSMALLLFKIQQYMKELSRLHKLSCKMIWYHLETNNDITTPPADSKVLNHMLIHIINDTWKILNHKVREIKLCCRMYFRSLNTKSIFSPSNAYPFLFPLHDIPR